MGRERKKKREKEKEEEDGFFVRLDWRVLSFPSLVFLHSLSKKREERRKEGSFCGKKCSLQTKPTFFWSNFFLLLLLWIEQTKMRKYANESWK